MQSAAEDIKDLLEAESGLGLEFPTNLFVGREPTEPDECVTIFDTPGPPPLQTLTRGEDYFYSNIQIRVRSGDYLSGMSLARNVMTTLHGRNHETWNDTSYQLIRCLGEPALLDWDDNERVRFVINFAIQRR